MTPTPEYIEPAVVPGAEPWSAVGTNGHGVVVLHGFTGNPSSMRGLAEAFHAAGFSVEMPRLPGHGTTADDLMHTSWDDWSATAEATYRSLSARVDKIVVAGLSMGGSLTCWLATKHPEIAGIVCVNPATQVSPDMRAAVEGLLEAGEDRMPGIASDIADPDAEEGAYGETPLAPLLSLFAAAEQFGPHFPQITCPVLLMTSPQDHVVPPTDSDYLASTVAGPVERISLERSYHVATLDYDKDILEAAAVDFAGKVTSS